MVNTTTEYLPGLPCSSFSGPVKQSPKLLIAKENYKMKLFQETKSALYKNSHSCIQRHKYLI